MTDDLMARVEAALARTTAEPDLPAVAAAARPRMLAELVRLLAFRPEGRYVRDQWLDEPLRYVVVTTEEDPALLTRVAVSAYAPSAPDSDDDSGPRRWEDTVRYVLAVPHLVVGLLEMSGSEFSHWAEVASVGGRAREALGDGRWAGRLADAASRLWRSEEMRYDLEADEAGVLLEQLAVLHDRPDRTRFDQAVAAGATLEGDLLVDEVRCGGLADMLTALVTSPGAR